MTDNNILTASHIRYLLALKRFGGESEIRSVDIANDLSLSKASVHYIMNTFAELKYIIKEYGGRVFLTEYVTQHATEFEKYHNNLKIRLFSQTLAGMKTDNMFTSGYENADSMRLEKIKSYLRYFLMEL